MSTKDTSPAKKGAPAPEEMPRKPLLRRLIDSIFGYDFFISYCPLDGKTYAASLYKQLVGRGYCCRIKAPKRYEKSESWDLPGRWALRKTNVLIVVGTKGAVSSLLVQREARRFHRRRKKIIPISFDGTLDRSLPRKGLLESIPSKLVRINATAAELATGPAPGSTERLIRIFDISRQSTRRAWYVLALALICAVLAAFSGSQWQLAEARFERAKQARYESDMALVQSLWDSGDWSSLIPLLERHHPLTGPDAQRGFEWSYRWLQLRMPVPTLQVHSGEVQSLACSPDGTMVAISSRAGMVSVRQISSGKLISILEWPADDVVNTLAFSPDGHVVAGVSEGKAVRIWDPLTGKPVKSWGLDKAIPPMALAFIEGGSTLMCETLTGAGTWQVETGTPNAPVVLQDDAEPVTDPLVFSPDGRHLVRLKKDHVVDIVVTQTKKSTEVATARGDLPYMVQFSPDGSLLAVQADDQSVHIREMGSGLELTSHDKPITASSTMYGMAFDVHNRWLAVGCGDGSIKVWNFRTGDLVADFKASSVRIYSVAFTPDGTRLIGGSLNGEVRVFSLGAPDADLVLSTGEKGGAAGKDNDVAMAFSRDGLNLATCAAGDSVRVIGLIDGKERARIVTRQGTILAMKFSDDGRRLGTLGNASAFNWWNIYETPSPTLAETRICDVGPGPVTITADGEWLVALTYPPDQPDARRVDIRRVAISGPERIFTTPLDSDVGPGVVQQVAVNPQGTLVAAVIGNDRGPGTLAVGEIESGKGRWLKRYRDETPRGVAFSPDSKLIVVESDAGHVWVYDIATGDETLALQSSRPSEDRLAVGGGPVTFDFSGRRIVTTGGDGSLRIWDSTLGSEMLAVKSHKRDVLNVIVSVRDRWIATKSRDKTVRVLRGSTEVVQAAPAVPQP